MLVLPLVWALLGSHLAHALGEPKAIVFPPSSGLRINEATGSQTVLSTSKHKDEWWPIVSAEDEFVVPFLLDSRDDIAIHLAANVLARDIHTITGYRPVLYNDTLPSNVSSAVIIGSVDSELVGRTSESKDRKRQLAGKWESYDARVVRHAVDGLDTALVITGSDRVSPHLSPLGISTSSHHTLNLCRPQAHATLIP